MAIKIVSAEAFNALSQKAAKHDEIVQALNAARAEGYSTELTAEEAVEMLLNPDNTALAEMQTQVDQLTGANTTLQETIDNLTTQNNTLQERVTELEAATPGAASATLNAEGEPIAKDADSDLASFAKEHAGDHLAIIAKMQEEGILPLSN